MSISKTQITVDGCDYTVESRYEGDVIDVIDATGQTVASAEKDYSVEALFFSYVTRRNGCTKEHGGCNPGLFDSNTETIAKWLVTTHPVNN